MFVTHIINYVYLFLIYVAFSFQGTVIRRNVDSVAATLDQIRWCIAIVASGTWNGAL